jgi:hypothetical protein
LPLEKEDKGRTLDQIMRVEKLQTLEVAEISALWLAYHNEKVCQQHVVHSMGLIPLSAASCVGRDPRRRLGDDASASQGDMYPACSRFLFAVNHLTWFFRL